MYRPIDKKLQKKSKLPSVKKLWSVEEKLGGWDQAQSKFFSANVSVCSTLYQSSRQAASSISPIACLFVFLSWCVECCRWVPGVPTTSLGKVKSTEQDLQWLPLANAYCMLPHLGGLCCSNFCAACGARGSDQSCRCQQLSVLQLRVLRDKGWGSALSK